MKYFEFGQQNETLMYLPARKQKRFYGWGSFSCPPLKYKEKLAAANKMEDIMKTTNKLTVPDRISIGVFTTPGFSKEKEHGL